MLILNTALVNEVLMMNILKSKSKQSLDISLKTFVHEKMNFETTLYTCKGCSKEFVIHVIRNHLAQKASCKRKYKPQEFDELDKLYNTYRKKKKAENYIKRKNQKAIQVQNLYFDSLPILKQYFEILNTFPE